MNTEQKAPNVLVIELVNQQPSSYVIDGGAGEDSDLPTHISAPNARKIKNRCKIAYIDQSDGDDKGKTKYKNLRYIKGSDVIEEEEQIKQNIKPNPSQDTIWVLNGKLTVIESGSDIGLYKFLKNHENNIDNPNRPEGAVNIFEEIDTNVEAIAMESVFDEEMKILNYLSTLKTKVGKEQYEYNDDALTFLCSLFKLPPHDQKYPAESWVSLVLYAKEFPKKFLNSMSNQKSLIEADVNQALSRGVVHIDEVKAFFEASKKIVMNFPPNLTSDEQKERLVDYMSNPKNRLYYDELRSQLHAVKINAAAVIE